MEEGGGCRGVGVEGEEGRRGVGGGVGSAYAERK